MIHSLRVGTFLVLMAACATRARAADGDGFALLRRAANEAPHERLADEAPPAELAEFVKRGAASWNDCARAIHAGISVPPKLDVVAIAEFRPLLRLLVARVRFALGESDMPAARESLRALVHIASTFAVADFRGRDDGFVADIYLVTALDEAASKLDHDSCQTIAESVRQYVKTWTPAAKLFNDQLAEDRRNHGEQAVTALQQSGQLGRARAAIDSKVKLHSAIYDLLLLKLAIRRYELDSGHLPKGLDALNEVTLVDPYHPDRGPFAYRVRDGGYTIYSVGPDGRDDNGARRSVADLMAGKKGDLVL